MRKSEGLYRDGERLMTEKEVSEWLNIPLATLRTLRYRREKKGPPHTKVGGAVRYSPTALRQYLESNTNDPSEKFILDIERKTKKSA